MRALLLALALAAPDGGPKVAGYEIDGKPATEAQFKARLAELHGQEHWSCAETSGGGFVRYVARDKAGKAFEVVESSDPAHASRIRADEL